MFGSRGFLASLTLVTLATTANVSAGEVHYANESPNWTSVQRREFYSLDQGARIMPFAWFKALRHPDGRHFIDDGLSRYGYLPNPDGEIPGLPVGFLSASEDITQYLSMTCSACHTRQIDVGGVSWRVDGGPALADFQVLLNDIDLAFQKILSEEAAFNEFAKEVLGGDATDRQRRHLRADVETWFKPYDTLMRKSLPTPGWGIGRADAVSMIFNRVAGLDIGTTHSRIIEGNIAKADAPVRYPFVWNAAIQDMTQWPGFAENGDDILGLARNVGEVYGVFGFYRPKKTIIPNVIDYLNGSSLNYPGLMRLETLIKQIPSPKWQWGLDQTLVAKGKEIFNRDPNNGGCAKNCHEKTTGEPRVCNAAGTWKTPLQDVGTDRREYGILAREADTGVLNGAKIPFIPGVDTPLKPQDKIFSILSLSVIGSIIEAPLHFGLDVFAPLIEECIPAAQKTAPEVAQSRLRDKLVAALQNLYRKPKANIFKYESRVMDGIWAAAPYLHNGSVPTLADLLKPVSERPGSFKVGTAYDTVNVGLAKEQGAFSTVYTADDCSKQDSGNSRCGHEYGVKLTAEEKKALLEYLKSL